METKEKNWVSRQIESAKRDVAAWPSWLTNGPKTCADQPFSKSTLNPKMDSFGVNRLRK